MLPEYFGDGLRSITSIDITDSYIYYTDAGIVGRVNRQTEEREILVQTNLQDSFFGLYAEEDFFIFSEFNCQTIYKENL